MDITRALAELLPGAMQSTAPADRAAYARDLWPRRLIEVRSGSMTDTKPGAIVWPETSEHVERLVQFARENGHPLVPFGAGSGVCGGIYPDAKAIVVDLKRFDAYRILPEAPSLEVGAGALGITLAEELERQGYTIGHFPSSILCSTVGGWVATRAAGQASSRYGKIEDMLLEAECVLGNGRHVRMLRRTSGPNPIDLLLGSEGTLGIVTSVRLRLHRLPRARTFASYGFRTLRAGCDALREIMQQGLRPSVARLYDEVDSLLLRQGSVQTAGEQAADPSAEGDRAGARERLMDKLLHSALRAPRAMNAATRLLSGSRLSGCTMILLLEGSLEHVRSDAQRADRICTRAGGATLGPEPARAWYAHRYSVSYRQSPIFRMGAFSDTMEVAAPWSKLDEVYSRVQRALGKHVFVLAHLSHAYPDGCSIYFTFSASARDDAECRTLYESAWRDALAAALSAGATLSHHHGVGRSKAPRLGAELGKGIALVETMMRAWDPDRILNPGNLLPDRERPSDEAGPLPELSSVPQWDERSLLVTLPGSMALAQAEAGCRERGYSLRVHGADSLEIHDWIARGVPGAAARSDDPVDQIIAGLCAEVPNVGQIVVRPSPRRAVGPDLMSLFRGAGGAIGRVLQATLRIHRLDAPSARPMPLAIDRDPPISEAERAAWDDLLAAFARR